MNVEASPTINIACGYKVMNYACYESYIFQVFGRYNNAKQTLRGLVKTFTGGAVVLGVLSGRGLWSYTVNV